jgi:hypothetical protein
MAMLTVKSTSKLFNIRTFLLSILWLTAAAVISILTIRFADIRSQLLPAATRTCFFLGYSENWDVVLERCEPVAFRNATLYAAFEILTLVVILMVLTLQLINAVRAALNPEEYNHFNKLRTLEYRLYITAGSMFAIMVGVYVLIYLIAVAFRLSHSGWSLIGS